MDTSWQVRVSGRPEEATANVFARKLKFVVGAPLQFDVEYDAVTAIEHLLGAVGADLCRGFLYRAKKHRLEVDSVEAVVEGRLNNALVYLDVQGEFGHTGLEILTSRVYINTLQTEEAVQPVWEETLRLSPLINTLRQSAKLELSYKLAF